MKQYFRAGLVLNMKVLLVRARPTKIENTRLSKSLFDEVGHVMPLGIASIAGYLRQKGIPVSMIDADAEGLSIEKLKERLIKLKPDIVGITSMTPTIHDDLDVAAAAKEIGARVVIGGPQLNAMPEETIRLKPIDFGILGEGEYPMFKLVEALSNNLPFNDVPGLIYEDKNGKLIMKPPYIHDDLDSLPLPARDLLPYERYFSIISQGRLATICPGRGCPFSCGFCFKQPSDRKIRHRSPKLIVDEMEELISNHGIKVVNFVSDTLTFKSSFVKTFCQELIDRKINIPWIAPTRVDCVTPELLRLMKKAGCKSLRFGVESGSSKILKLMGKDIDKKKIISIFKCGKELKIETFAYFILGYLQETEETMRETLNFAKELNPDLLMYNIATPLPATRLFEQAVETGLVEADYWKNFLLDKNYPRVPYLFGDVEKWITRAYHEFFFSPRFMFRKMLEIRPDNIICYLKAARGLLGLGKK